MIRLVASFAMVCACHAAFAGGQPAAARETVPLTRFTSHPHAFAEYSGLNDSVRTVVRDSAAWQQLWDRVNAPYVPKPPRPDVDFHREMIVVAAIGREPSGGYDVVIDSAAEDTSSIEVVVRRTIPGERCLTTAAVTQPVDLAKIPASDKPVRFREREQRVACGGRAP